MWTLVREKIGTRVPLALQTTVYCIGRGKDCFIRCGCLYASRHHCNIVCEKDRIYIIDLKSFNGTFINGNRIPTEERVNLKENDLIGVGVPDVIDDNSYVYRLVVEKKLSPVDQNSPQQVSRKRSLVEPEEQNPAKILRKDTTSVPNDSFCDQNVSAAVNTKNNSHGDSRTHSSSVTVFANHDVNKVHTAREAVSISPKLNDAEVIDLVDSDDEQVSLKPDDKNTSKSSHGNQVPLPVSMVNNGYTDENDVIVISDDEDGFLSTSQLSLEGNSNVDRNDLSPVNGEEGLLEKDEDVKKWEILDSEDESDNEWWPRLSQSFSENIQEEVEGENIGQSGVNDNIDNDNIGIPVDVGENERTSDDLENDVGVISDGEEVEGNEKASDDLEDDGRVVSDNGGEKSDTSDLDDGDAQSSSDMEEGELVIDMDEKEKTLEDSDNETATTSENFFPVLSQGFSDSEEEYGENEVKKEEHSSSAQDDQKNIGESIVENGISECMENLFSISISKGDGESSRRKSEELAGPSERGSNLGNELVKSPPNRELKLSLSSLKHSKGPQIVAPPTLKRGRICVWEDGEKKEPVKSPVHPVEPETSEGTIKLKPCYVLLKDVRHCKELTKEKRDRRDSCKRNRRKKSKYDDFQRKLLSKEDKRKIKEERRLRLQALSGRDSKEETALGEKFKTNQNNCSIVDEDLDMVTGRKSETVNKDSRHGKVVAKVTARNRGAFLTEFDFLGASKDEPKDKVGKKKSSKTETPSKTNGNDQNNKAKEVITLAQATTSSCQIDTVSPSTSTKIRIQEKHVAIATNTSSLRGILKPSKCERTANKRRKQVRFIDSPKINYYEVSPGNKMMPVRGKDLPIRPVNQPSAQDVLSSSRVILDICRWNAHWLEEQKSKPPDQPPPVATNYNILPMMVNFPSYKDYFLTFYPLLMYELWAKIYKEWDQNCARNPVIQVVLDPWTSSQDVGSSDTDEFVFVNCQYAFNGDVSEVDSCPKIGDLCVFEFPEAISPSIQNTKEPQPFVYVRVFAYVESVKKLFSSWKTQVHLENPHLREFNVKLTLKIKKRPKEMCIGKLAKMKVVCQLSVELRSFEALLDLPKSPLMKYILNPSSLILRTFIPQYLKTKSSVALNPSQEKAVALAKMVATATEPRMCLIKGPPGTGKTKVIVSLIMDLFDCGKKTLSQKRRVNATPKILLCAPSNAAIDNVVMKLLAIRTTLSKDNRFRLVRVGRIDSMNPAVRDISLQELTAKEITNNINNADEQSFDLQLSTLEARINSLKLSMESVKQRHDYEAQKLVELKLSETVQKWKDTKKVKASNAGNLSHRDQRQVEEIAERNVLQCADIVATTLTSSVNSSMLEAFASRSGIKSHFSCCIIDEATQSVEMDTLIPMKLGISNFVLVGDQEQLSPTVMSMVAKRNGLEVSLFERMWSSMCMNDATIASMPIVMLNVQYRMHPEICQWPNAYVYHNLLETPTELANERLSPFLPYVVISLEFDQHDPNQLLNCSEAELVSRLYFAIHEKTEKRGYSIGIITPYQKQKSAIQSAIARRRSAKGMGDTYLHEVNTIDSFQGQERDIVLLSCVRSYGIGFLGERKRINVALTRAKRSLIVCGNFASLKDHELWNSFLTDGLSRRLVRCVSGSNVPNQKDILKLVLRNP